LSVPVGRKARASRTRPRYPGGCGWWASTLISPSARAKFTESQDHSVSPQVGGRVSPMLIADAATTEATDRNETG
jgi:hypothetical protein